MIVARPTPHNKLRVANAIRSLLCLMSLLNGATWNTLLRHEIRPKCALHLNDYSIC